MLTVQAGGKRYVHYDNWLARRAGIWGRAREPGVFRVDIELARPAHFLGDVQVERNPHGPIDAVNGLGERVRHGGFGFDAHTVYYACDEWTTAWGVVEAEHPEGGPSLRFLAESSRADPALGERFILYSSSGTVWTEPWGANRSNHFVFVRNRFWFATVVEFEPPWKSLLQYPLIDQVCDWELGAGDDRTYGKHDFLPPTYLAEEDDPPLASFMEEIFRDLTDPGPLLVCMDWLADHRGPAGAGLAEYVHRSLFPPGEQSILDLGRAWDQRHKWHLRGSGRRANLRTLQFTLVNLIQDAHALAGNRPRLLHFTRFARGPFASR
jgi:hypothetical protein